MRRNWLLILCLIAVIPLCFGDENKTCYEVKELSVSEDKCLFVKNYCKEFQIGYIDYFKLYYCSTDSIFIHILILCGMGFLLLYIFISLGLTSSEFLCPNLSTISYYFNIPDNLSGLTLLAFGNGSPDILATYNSFASDNGSLAIGELVGSAFLITSIVIGTMAIVSPFEICNNETNQGQDKLVYIRDLIFFIISIILVIVFLSDSKLNFIECLTMVLLYIIYVLIIISWSWILKMNNEQMELDRKVRNVYNYNQNDIVIEDLEEIDDELEQNNNNNSNNSNNAREIFYPDTLSPLTTPNHNLSSSYNAILRPSLLDALEFSTVLADLSKQRTLQNTGNIHLKDLSTTNKPISVVSDEQQAKLIKQSLMNNKRPKTEPLPYNPYTDYAPAPFTSPANIRAYRDNPDDSVLDYESRINDVPRNDGTDQEEEEIEESTQEQNQPKFSQENIIDNIKLYFTKMKFNNNGELFSNDNFLLVLLPNLKKISRLNFISKLFNLFCIPVLLLLRLTIPVRNNSDLIMNRNDDFNFENPEFSSFHENIDADITNRTVSGSKLNNELLLIIIQTALSTIMLSLTIFEPKLITILISLIFSTIFSVIIFSILKDTTKYHNFKNFIQILLAFIGFMTSIAWISIFAKELINILKFFSIYLDLSEAILGLTIFAIGNSIGDLISNFTIAKMGFPLMSLAACFGGPLLNILLGIGMNGLVVIEQNNTSYFDFEIDPSLIVSSTCLLLNLIFLIIYIPFFNNWKFDRAIGFMMVGFWCFGTLINIIIEINSSSSSTTTSTSSSSFGTPFSL
ncbi:hypothetical protein PACTADRAFT_32501 [Pachysolen tannophilus NRRL Y-2460]|uniref:Sodium/calcium exchanger membrane region domain-containing protein n=1 Tax=Pachysolen tannophilus NRRL Y-2460 TaxID=669874 RepID=A0A1E4TZ17_PACTA|nr:hypothetical protein PACTADRAFT_32501 [Pachysolen tannophilus NRRL Y-2460]